ncbi:metal-dependent hydrolase [Halalkalibaculum sp. DA3122]|uniref:metal-dependent hydrolase n=1 Tax=Halalkalibaculum sp. DA3122 TaxID=3373607 RepID=UPI003754B99C
MDPVTHGLIGASASQSFADKEKLRLAALAGATGAMLPDLDILIGTSSDPLLTLEFHRQFTHALLFIPVGALLAAVACWWLVKKKLSFKETYSFTLLGTATAGIADVFTSYGVQLLWPLTDERFAWNLVSVFDPLFSLGLILTVGLALYRKQKGVARISFIWITVYLLFAITQQQQARLTARALASQRNHFVERLVVKPTIANQLLWSTRYVSGNRIYADGVRIIPFSKPQVFRGRSTQLIPWQQTYARYKGTTLYNDIKRFSTLSEGLLVAHPDRPQVIGDGRYAMLPTSVTPLWGIVADTTRAKQHVEFKTYRDASPEIRNAFLRMLRGEYPD